MSLKLFCVVCPDVQPSKRIFQISIDKTEIVADLKDAIKLKSAPRLDHIDAVELELYKVSIPDNNDLGQALDSLLFDGSENYVTELQPMTELSTLFPDGAKKEHLEIVVQKPGTCYTPSDSFRTISHRPDQLTNSYEEEGSFIHTLVSVTGRETRTTGAEWSIRE